jgi:hypothetical protein
MQSPFPGMDPYLEKYWHEVHQGLIIYTRDILQENLPPALRARAEQRVVLEEDSGNWRTVVPDLHVVEFPKEYAVAEPPKSALAVEDEPVLITPRNEPLMEGYIEIVDVESGNRVVTVIEYLSPTNKLPSWGRGEYVKKQAEVIRAGANLVEIDLNRSGQRSFALEARLIPKPFRTTYQVCVWRGMSAGRFEVYRAPLDRRLPTIRIPLRVTDDDLRLDLQSLVKRCYANGRYDDLDYRGDPNPPLEGEDAAWAQEMLQTRGLR